MDDRKPTIMRSFMAIGKDRDMFATALVCCNYDRNSWNQGTAGGISRRLQYNHTDQSVGRFLTVSCNGFFASVDQHPGHERTRHAADDDSMSHVHVQHVVGYGGRKLSR